MRLYWSSWVQICFKKILMLTNQFFMVRVKKRTHSNFFRVMICMNFYQLKKFTNFIVHNIQHFLYYNYEHLEVHKQNSWYNYGFEFLFSYNSYLTDVKSRQFFWTILFYFVDAYHSTNQSIEFHNVPFQLKIKFRSHSKLKKFIP